MTRPTNEAAAIRAEFVKLQQRNMDELNAKHRQVVQFYQDCREEDADTISSLASRVDELQNALKVLLDVTAVDTDPVFSPTQNFIDAHTIGRIILERKP